MIQAAGVFYRRGIKLAAMLLLLWPLGQPQAEVVRMGADDWCPYVCDPQMHDGKEGYLVDILRQAFALYGHRVETSLLPFARNVALNRNGQLQGIVGVYQGDVSSFYFPDNALGYSRNFFYVLKSSDWRYRNPESLDQIDKIGLVLQYHYANKAFVDYLQQHPDKADRITGNRPLLRNVRKLLVGRIDTLVEDKQVVEFWLNKLNMRSLVVPAGELSGPQPVYIAFSPELPESEARRYIQWLDEGVGQLRQSGELSAILQRYGLADWQLTED